MRTGPTNIKSNYNEKWLYTIVLLFSLKTHLLLIYVNRKLIISSEIVTFVTLFWFVSTISVNYCTSCFPLYVHKNYLYICILFTHRNWRIIFRTRWAQSSITQPLNSIRALTHPFIFPQFQGFRFRWDFCFVLFSVFVLTQSASFCSLFLKKRHSFRLWNSVSFPVLQCCGSGMVLSGSGSYFSGRSYRNQAN